MATKLTNAQHDAMGAYFDADITSKRNGFTYVFNMVDVRSTTIAALVKHGLLEYSKTTSFGVQHNDTSLVRITDAGRAYATSRGWLTPPPAASETPAHDSAQDAAFAEDSSMNAQIPPPLAVGEKVYSVRDNGIITFGEITEINDGLYDIKRDNGELYVAFEHAIFRDVGGAQKYAAQQHAANTPPQAERGERDAQPLTPENDIHTFMLAERDAKDARIARLEAALEVARKTLSDLKYGNLRPYEVAFAIQDALETIERHNNESEDTTTN